MPALAALVFACFSLAIVPYPGLQNDEVLHTQPLYTKGVTYYSVEVAGHTVPLMLMSYLGTLKTWAYWVIFGFVDPSRWSVRVPMIAVGALTIILTWLWTRRVAGTLAAGIAAALLATDSVFIFTNTFDWGPVAFQHVLFVGGLLALQGWIERDSRWMLALGFFLWGVGMWDKALMTWNLVGLSVAAVCVFPRECLRRTRLVPAAIAATSFLIGALPLVLFNVAHQGETFRGNTKLLLSQIPQKVEELRLTFTGGVLQFIASTTPGPIATGPRSILERTSVFLRGVVGHREESLMLYGLGLSLLCMVVLFFRGRWRLPLFLLITMTVAWLQMAANTGTGGGAHHTILLWPFPCVLVGVCLAGAMRGSLRPAAIVLAAILVIANFLTANEYLADLSQNGGLGGWTDGFYRLSGAMWRYRNNRIGIVDWGYLNGLNMLYDGKLNAVLVRDVVHDNNAIRQMAESPDFIFVQHTDNAQLFAGVNEELRTAALAAGYAEHIERTVHDNQGRPVFEIFRFVKANP